MEAEGTHFNIYLPCYFTCSCQFLNAFYAGQKKTKTKQKKTPEMSLGKKNLLM